MTKEGRRENDALSREEIERQEGEELPDRHHMSILDAGVAIPPDPALAADILSSEPVAEEEDEGTEGVSNGEEEGT